MENDELITVPYKKKRIRRVPPKANHKHMREDCVFEFEDTLWMGPSIGSYCPRCGKVLRTNAVLGSQWYIDRAKPGSRLVIPDWTDDAKREFDPETRTLPYFRLKDAFTKFIEPFPPKANKNKPKT